MNIEQIKSLDQSDFVTNNSKVWAAIEELSIDDLNTLLKENYKIWGCEQIDDGIREVIFEKSIKLIENKLTEMYRENKIAFDFLIDNGTKIADIIDFGANKS